MEIKLLILLSLIYSCDSSVKNTLDELESDSETSEKIIWYVNDNELIGKFEPFPEIDSLVFHNNSNNINVSEKHRAALIDMDGKKYAFLYGDLAYYESLNFTINNKYYAITHCPITNTSIAFELETGQKIRASGYRLKDNLIFYNSSTKDFVSQMLQQTIGSFKNLRSKAIKTIPILDTEWKYVKNLNNLNIAKVTDKDLGVYNFPTNYRENELQLSNMSISINIDILKKEVQILEFKNYDDCFLTVVESNIILGNKNLKTINVFNNKTVVSFSDSKDYLVDSDLNKYDYTGYCFYGSKKGQTLIKTNSYIGSTVAFETIFNKVIKK